MSNIFYHLIEGVTVDNVVAFNPGSDTPLLEADSKHPHWQAIIKGLKAGDESVFDLFDVQGGLIKRLKSLSDRIDYDGTNVLFDGDVVNDALATQIRRFLEQGVEDYAPLVRFWEKLATNPNEHSRTQLFGWLKSHDFTITEDGDIVGYKGVKVVGNIDGQDYRSIHAGPATVDGVAVSGHVPNKPGTVVSMPRASVKHDPNVACHTGLHVGTWSYANSFAPVVLEVHVNPRDVVSIPGDSGQQKMRCCKYTVVQKLGKHYASAVLRPTEDVRWQGDVGYAPEKVF